MPTIGRKNMNYYNEIKKNYYKAKYMTDQKTI